MLFTLNIYVCCEWISSCTVFCNDLACSFIFVISLMWFRFLLNFGPDFSCTFWSHFSIPCVFIPERIGGASNVDPSLLGGSTLPPPACAPRRPFSTFKGLQRSLTIFKGFQRPSKTFKGLQRPPDISIFNENPLVRIGIR